MPIRPFEQLTMLREHHVYDFTHRQLQVLALNHNGQTPDAMARRLHITVATVRRHMADAMRKIFDTLPIDPTHTGAATYTSEHATCCTRACVEIIENDQFP